MNTAQQLRRSVPSDCVTLDNLHYPHAALHPFVKQRKYFTAYWENDIIVLVRCLQTKSVSDKHHKKHHPA